MKRTLLSYATSGFEGCCSVGVIYDLAAATEKERDEDDWGGLFYNEPQDIHTAVTEPMVLATTIPQQREAIALLKKGGFRKLASWMGFNGNRITLWGKAKPNARARYK